MPFKVRNSRSFLSFASVCLLAFFLAGFAVTPALAGHKFALVVGITQYRDKPLYGCVNDATGMRDLLVERFGFDRADATLLTNSAATRAGIVNAIERYIARVKGGDLFVFFYSGHGTVFPDSLSADHDETQILDMSWLRAQGVNLVRTENFVTLYFQKFRAISSNPYLCLAKTRFTCIFNNFARYSHNHYFPNQNSHLA